MCYFRKFCVGLLVLFTCVLLVSLNAQTGNMVSVVSVSTQTDVSPKTEETSAQPNTGSLGGGTVISWFIAGGPVMWPLLGTSIFGLAFTFFLAFALRKKKIFPADFINSIKENLSTGDINQTMEICSKNNSFISKVFNAGLQRRGESKEKIIENMQLEANLYISTLQKVNGYINTVGVVAPMLGLLGTVTGMVSTFNTIAFAAGAGKPELLAKGIAEALITTETGLFIGIPAFTMYFIYKVQLQDIIAILEKTLTDFIDQLEKLKSVKK